MKKRAQLEPEPEERAILRCWSGEVIDITDDVKEAIKELEELEKERENKGLRGLFKKIRNKVSKRPNGAQQD